MATFSLVWSRFKPSASRVVRLYVIGVVFAVILAGTAMPFLKSLDNELLDRRFAAAPRSASGDIIYLAIDKRTLDSVGIWPWPRSIYAGIIHKLSGFGVSDIFIDIDFSTPSSALEDKKLADALADAGGGVILPVFRQHISANGDTAEVVSRPIATFADNAWLAFANVALEDGGTIRRFQLGDMLDGRQTQSVASVLSKAQRSGGSALIDYSIDPSTVPTISLAELMDPSFDGDRLKDRSIVIGAYATELKDIFPVPVYGQLSGPMLHILAAETLLQNRQLVEFDQFPIELALAAVVIAVALAFRASSAAVPCLLAFFVGVAGEATAFYLQKTQGLIVHTTMVWVILLLGLILTLTEKVDFTRFLADLANAEQRNIRRLLRKIVADSTDAVLAFDHTLKIFEASGSAGPMLGAGENDSRGRMLVDVVPNHLYELVGRLVSDHAEYPHSVHSSTGQVSFDVDGVVRHLDATVTISPVERPEEAVALATPLYIGSLMIRDVTARQLYEQRLRHLSQYDDLTGLMNRRTFSEHLQSYEDPIYVLAVGLHRLNVINATMGRDFGDEVLRGVAERFKATPLITSTGRLGGDVFVVAIPQYAATDHQRCVELVMDLLCQPLAIGESNIQINARIGICTNTIPGETGNAWIERAEHALDDAKSVAGSGWRAYDPAAALQQQTARELEHAMRDSLQRGEFFLVYQPQVDLRTGRLQGAEALLRWKHPEFGLVSPATFIPVAEANGFVCDLGQWALNEACREAARWPEGLSVAVNVAPIQLIRTDLVADVKSALKATGLAPSRLHLEITESAFVEHSGPIMAALGELRQMGIKIALDDFGTGYSSLSYLVGFPLDKLKIDQSFIRKMAVDPQSLAIVQTVKALAEGLGLQVVAEGIETQIESQLLAAMNCEVGQGYYFGKPQSPAELMTLLDTAPWRSVA